MKLSLLTSSSCGWFVLGALVALTPQMVGCDGSESSDAARAPAPVVDSAHAEASTTRAAVERPSPKEAEPANAQPRSADGSSAADAPSEPREEPTASADAGSQSADEKRSATADAPEIRRLIIAEDIKEREPVELKDARVDKAVVAFVELRNQGEVDSGVVITFEHEDGKKVGFIELTVPADSPRYRTWGRTRNIKQAGTWHAVVSSKDGKELARQSFEVAG